MRPTVRIRAPGKVNVALAVGPRSPSDTRARHSICSWMVTVDLYDDLTVTTLEPGTFSRYAILWAADARRKSDIDWSITKDLAVRAHAALEHAVGRPLPVQLKLEKRIPVGAGLGGGSSDAAAMLRACNELFSLGLDDHRLRAIAADIGSDVAFFIRGGSSIVEGFGERISATAPPSVPMDLVLCMPDFACATAPVYEHFDRLASSNSAAAVPSFASRAAMVRVLASAVRLGADAPFNDLAPAAIGHQPRLADIAAAVSRTSDRPAHLTGSGSALFVVCDNDMHSEYLARAIVTQCEGVVAIAVRAPDSSGTRIG